MSGTSLDGVDAVIAQFQGDQSKILHSISLPYPEDLRSSVLALHEDNSGELELALLTGNQLARVYATAVTELLATSGIQAAEIHAIGCHGQTVRHRPDLGYTLQLGNHALVAELSGITVVADFRSRDIAAGGQGAPLVPAFHEAVFSHLEKNRAIINIGGIANITCLPTAAKVTGFDTGPGNMLMDAWIQQHLGEPFDPAGLWAATGEIIEPLLDKLLAYPFFTDKPPKSTGRDLFNLTWLQTYLDPNYIPADVQRTLLEFTARSISVAVHDYCDNLHEIYLCGGGAYNDLLVQRLQQLLHPVRIGLTDDLGIHVRWVEAAAFAWLARQCMHRKPGNLAEVTGAAGPRILGAIYSY